MIDDQPEPPQPHRVEPPPIPPGYQVPSAPVSPQVWTPPPVDYYRGQGQPPASSTPAGIQAGAGLLFYFLTLGGVIGMYQFQTLSDFPALGTIVFFSANLAAIFVAERRYQWRSFKAGVLVGLPLSCLIGIGVLAYACWGSPNVGR